MAALFLGACIIGFSPIWVRWSPVDPTATGFYRVGIALPVMLGFWAFRGNGAVYGPGPGWPFLLLPGFFFACDIALWHWAIQYTSVSNSTLLGNLAPIFVTLAAWRLFQERVTPLFVGGLVTALAGTVLLMGQSLQLTPGHLWGDALSVCTAVFYAAYQLTLNRLRQRYPTHVIMACVCLSATVFLLAVTLALGEPLAWRGPGFWAGLGALLGLSLLSQVSGQGLIAYSLRRLPVSFSSVTLLIQPMVAAAAAWVLLGESLSPSQVAGSVVVLIGIVLARRGSMPRPAQPCTERINHGQ